MILINEETDLVEKWAELSGMGLSGNRSIMGMRGKRKRGVSLHKFQNLLWK